MKTVLQSVLLIILLYFSACHERTGNSGKNEAIVADGADMVASLPADAIAVTKPLISGALYNRPSFDGDKLALFDTAQQIQVLDTSNAIFIKARILQDTASIVGYVSKAILPEKR